MININIIIMKILEVLTEHAATIKILIEVLKDLLPEGNLEFTRGNSTSNKVSKDDDDNLLSSSSDDENTDNKSKALKSLVKNNINDSDSDSDVVSDSDESDEEEQREKSRRWFENISS